MYYSIPINSNISLLVYIGVEYSHQLYFKIYTTSYELITIS